MWNSASHPGKSGCCSKKSGMVCKHVSVRARARASGWAGSRAWARAKQDGSEACMVVDRTVVRNTIGLQPMHA